VNIFLTAVASIGLSVAAQFALKAGVAGPEMSQGLWGQNSLRAFVEVFTNKFVILGFVLYGLSAVVWLGVLSRWDVSKAYPLVGLGFALTVVIGLLAGEQVTVLRAVGVLLIVVGVCLVGQS
jgi:multidrug transporter EmrE-like cation transporter